jgi:hypothetical protein
VRLRGRSALVAASLGAALLISSCSSSSTVTPTPQPANTGATCDDPAGDLTPAGFQGTGSLRDPAGIDIVHAEARVTDTGLRVSFTTAGPVLSAPSPEFVLGQGQSGTPQAFELRAAPNGSGTWEVTLVTNTANPATKSIEEKRAVLTVPVKVEGNQLSFEVPSKDVPKIATFIWAFGTTSGPEDASVIDYCDESTGSAPTGTQPGTSVVGSTAPPTTVPDAALGQEQAFATGSKVTVYAVQSPPKAPSPDATPPDDGFQLAVVDAQVCAGDKQIQTHAGFFYVKLVTNQIYPVRANVAPGVIPGFPADQSLPASQCVRGWLTFQIPIGGSISEVLYSPNSDSRGALYWTTA